MKKTRIFGFILISAVLALSGCKTTDVVTDDETKTVIEKTEDKSVKEQLKEEKPKEPEDPPNIAFAKKLKETLAKGSVKEAIALFDEIPDELKTDVDLKMVLASLYISDGQYDKAVEIANEILILNPDNLAAMELLTICARATSNDSLYKETSKKILAVDPYNVQVNLMEGENQALNHKWKNARDAYTKALKTEPDNEDALFGYAKMTYYMDDLKTAKEYCQKIIDKNGENAQALSLMGKLAAEEFNYVRAIKYTKDALMYDPENFDYYMDLGTYYHEQGKNQDAIEAWKKAVEIQPDYFLGYAYLAGIYDETEQFDLALYNYRKVIETRPDYYYAYESTAILEYHFGNYDNARALFNQAYSYSQDYCYKLMIMAMYLKEGNKNTAKQIMNETLKTLERDSVEYNMVRMYCDNYSKNAESTLVNKINKEDNRNKRGKMLFYMGLFFEINGSQEMANEYYAKVTNMQAPMFFEYRLAEWGLGL